MASVTPREKAGWRSITPDLALLLVNVTLYAVCFQMQSPVQLFYVKQFVDSGTADVNYTFGLLRTVFSGVQLVGALIAGLLIDRFGVKGVLLLSFAASVLSYAALLNATSVYWLYAAQLPTVAQQAVLAVRAYVTIVGSDADRATHLGYVGAAYGVGFVIGPALGGWLASRSLQLNALTSTLGSLLSLILVYVFVDERRVVAAKARVAAADKAELKETSSIREGLAAAWASPTIRSLMQIKLVSTLALAVFHSVFSLIADSRFGMDAAGVGVLMSFVGGVGLLSQVLLVDVVTKRFSRFQVGVACSLVSATAFAVYAVISDTTSLFIVCVPIVIANTIYGLQNSSEVAEATPAAVKGSLVAAEMAIFSGVRMVAPAIGAYLLNSIGFWSLGGSASALMVLTAAMIAVRPTHAASDKIE